MSEPIVIEVPTDAPIVVTVPEGRPGLGVPAGGSTGQILAKTAGGDYATAWVAPGASQAAVDTAIAAAVGPLLPFALGIRLADVRSYVQAGETLDYTGVASTSVILQRAVDALSALYLADGIPRQLVLPAGIYRLATQLYIEPGVGLLGAGRDVTVLMPEAHESGLTIRTINIKPADLGGTGKTYDDCHFADFTVDASRQDNTVPSLSVKGIFLQWLRRCTFRRVAVRNTLGTGFGCDYLRDVLYDSCVASGCGRSASGNTGAGAGFGFATGWYDDEPIMVRNCLSTGNKTHGYFTECKWDGTTVYPAGPVKHTRGYSMVGCVATGNYEGFRDGGSSGAIVMGCSFYGNTGPGATVGPTPANLTGGKDGRISGCTISGNGSDGVTLDRMRVGGYTVADNEILGNVRYGISRTGSGAPWLYSVLILRNRVHDNGGAGIRFPIGTDQLTRLGIIENDIYDNGSDTGLTDRDGIVAYCMLFRPTIRGNRVYNTAGAQGTQQYGIWLRGSVVSTEPVIENNDVRVNAAGSLRVDHTVADQSCIRSNILPGYAWSDSFTRADSATLGFTETGDKAWTLPSSTVGGIASNQGFAQSTDSVGRVAAVDSGSPNGVGTFTVTLAVAGAQRRGRTVARGGGATSTTHIALEHRTSSGDFHYRVLTRSGTTDTVVFTSPTVLSADGDVHQIIQAANGDVTINVNGSLLWTGNIPYATVPASGRHGFGGTSAFGTDGGRFDNASFVPA